MNAHDADGLALSLNAADTCCQLSHELAHDLAQGVHLQVV